MRHVDRLLTSLASATSNAQEAKVRDTTPADRREAMSAVLLAYDGTTDEEKWAARAMNEWRQKQPPERNIDPITLWLIGLLISVAIQVVVRWWLNHRDSRERGVLLGRWSRASSHSLFDDELTRDDDEYE